MGEEGIKNGQKKIRRLFCDEFACACQEFAIAATEVGSTYLHKIEGLFLLCQLSQRKKYGAKFTTKILTVIGKVSKEAKCYT